MRASRYSPCGDLEGGLLGSALSASARVTDGTAMVARMAMMTTTTITSMSVKPRADLGPERAD